MPAALSDSPAVGSSSANGLAAALGTGHYGRLTQVRAVPRDEEDESFAFGGDAQRFRRQPVPVV
jgi:hypothetical protein